MENINALVDLKRNDEVQQLTIVTTNGFTKDILDTAERNKIELLTFRELQHRIANFDHYLDYLIKDFRKDKLSNYYIDLIAQDDEKIPRKIFDPIDKYVIEWIDSYTMNHLSILGEYGIGKTALMIIMYSGLLFLE